MPNSEKPAFVKIRDNNSLVRNTNSRAIINVDTVGLAAHRQRRGQILKQKQLAEDNNSEIKLLRKEVEELRALVNQCMAKI